VTSFALTPTLAAAAGLSHGDRLDVGASLLGRREPVGVFPPSFSASER